MKLKLVAAGLAGLFVFGSADVWAQETPEPSAVEFRFDAELRPRLEARFNHHFGLDAAELRYGGAVDEGDIFTQRSRVGVEATKGKLSARLTLQHSARWGDFRGDQFTIPPLYLYEGWMRYEASEQVFIELGRFRLDYGEQRVLGSAQWTLVARSWDGVRLGVRPGELLEVDLFGVKMRDAQEGFLRGDAYLAGAYSVFTEPVPGLLNTVDIYLLYDHRDGVPAPGEIRRNLGMAGVRIDGGVSIVGLEGEAGYQFGRLCDLDAQGCVGEGRPIHAYFFDLELGLGLPLIRPFVGFSMASGDDPETDGIEGYDPMYGTGHKWLGLMDIIGGRTNLREFRVGAAMSVQDFGIRLVAHDFTRLQPQVENVGQEVDLVLSYQVGDGLSVELGHGLFIPREGITEGDESPAGVANWSCVQATGRF